MRLEMAKFLQDTVGEVALSGTSKAEAAKEFTEFFNKLRNSGDAAKTDDILRVAQKFQGELTLNNLSRPQLVSMAKYLNLPAFGTDSFLRSQIDNKLISLFADDQAIYAEGVDLLDLSELQQACLARGIRTVGVSPARMRMELAQWLDLGLNHKVPSSLLLLSHAFQTTEYAKTSDDALKNKAEALQATLSSLPHQVLNEAKLRMSEASGTATLKQKLDVLKEQEEMIADELEEDESEQVSKKEELEKRKIADDFQKKQGETMDKSTTPNVVITPIDHVDAATHKSVEAANILPNAADHSSADAKAASDDDQAPLTPAEMANLSQALKAITEDSPDDEIRKLLGTLKYDRAEYKEDIEELENMLQKKTTKASNIVGSRVDKMIHSIEKELLKYESVDSAKLNFPKASETGQISIAQLEEALKVIKNSPDDNRIKSYVQKLDGDQDGLVAINEILSLVKDEKSAKEGNDKIT